MSSRYSDDYGDGALVTSAVGSVGATVRFNERPAEIYYPKGMNKNNTVRCTGCGGLVKLPCVLCLSNRSSDAKIRR